ncbi:type II secretion system F family protein [Promicromonospora sp. NPDC057488]|uniref:type II secretion system F family protein n=1 Tax=Promicromonospora sp. NPDC057488 TaxID=3346147 RepID=UPI003672FABF
MTTGLQIALFGGAVFGLGIALLVWRLLPADPDVVDVVRRYSPEAAKERSAVRADVAAPGAVEKLGVWAMRRLPLSVWGRTPTKELALLRVPVHRHYGTKVFYALAGLVVPPILSYYLVVVGLPIPFVVPVGGSLVLAAFLFLAPDMNVRSDAKKARADFSRALGVYTDLVALERLSGAGSRQAMESAAEVGDNWVFRRIGEELQRSRWNGVAPWDSLQNLSDELGLPELTDLADVMRMSGEGSQIYDNLRARSTALRSAMLNTERATANAVSERINMPMSLLGVVFMIILVTPALLRVMGDI